jgi:hypothetical protein
VFGYIIEKHLIIFSQILLSICFGNIMVAEGSWDINGLGQTGGGLGEGAFIIK